METKDLKTLYMANLKAAKEKLGKSVSKMALDMNMSSSTINSYLQGERTVSLEFVTRLYENYGINANWFCTGKGNMFNSAPENVSSSTKDEIIKTVEEYLKTRGI